MTAIYGSELCILDEEYARDIRSNPLSKEEFIEYGISESVYDQYCGLIRNLYGELFIEKEVNLGDTYQNSQDCWYKLLTFAVDNKLLQPWRCSWDESPFYNMPDIVRNFKFAYHWPEIPDFIYYDNVSSFRILVESNLVLYRIDYNLLIKRDVYRKMSSDDEYIFKRTNASDILTEKDIKDLLVEELSDLEKSIEYRDKLLSLNEELLPVRDLEPFGNDITTYDELLSSLVVVDKNISEICCTINSLAAACSDMTDEDETDNSERIPETYDGNILWVYKDNLVCITEDHDVVDAVAILHNSNGKDIELNVSYCKDCQAFFIDYNRYKHYRNKYGAILGNIRFASGGRFTGSTDYNLNEESPLHLCGYSVSQKEGLSSLTRQKIIIFCIEEGIMKKKEIESFLSWLIRRNENRRNMALAIDKWCEDYDFVISYDTDIRYVDIINQVKAYSPSRYMITTGKSVLRDIDTRKERKTKTDKVKTTSKDIMADNGNTVKAKPLDLDYCSYLGRRILHVEHGEGEIVEINGLIADIRFDKDESVKRLSLPIILENSLIELI